MVPWRGGEGDNAGVAKVDENILTAKVGADARYCVP